MEIKTYLETHSAVRFRIPFAIVFLLTCFLVFPVMAEIMPVDTIPEEPTTAVNNSGLGSPHETMQTFLTAMGGVENGNAGEINRAVSTLNLENINALVRSEKGRDIAWLLRDVLNRNGPVNLRKIPDRQTGKPFVYQEFKEGSISIALRLEGRWLFSAETVRALPAIHKSLSNQRGVGKPLDTRGHLPWHLRIRDRIPESLKRKWILLEHWQWIGILLIITVGFLVDKLIVRLLNSIVRQWRKGVHMPELWLLPDDWLRPLGLLAMAGVWWAGVNALGLPTQALVILLVAVKLLAGLSGVWAGYRSIDFMAAYLQHHARKSENKLDDVLVPLVRKTLKVFMTVVGILFIAANLNLNISGLMAGLGLGGLAFALAAKDMVQNLFGSVTVLLDQSFHVGDWVVIGDVEGTVEEVGLRSTRIRTFYNSQVILPNSKLITANIDNMGKRRFRRLKCKISLVYATPPGQIEAFCEAVRELIRLHPYMRKDYYQVYLNELSGSSLDVLVYVFWETPDWSTELRERHRFLLDTLSVAERLGVEMAFPSQTIYWKKDVVQADKSEVPSPNADLPGLLEDARDVARSVVAEGVDSSKKPPPVSFNKEL